MRLVGCGEAEGDERDLEDEELMISYQITRSALSVGRSGRRYKLLTLVMLRAVPLQIAGKSALESLFRALKGVYSELSTQKTKAGACEACWTRQTTKLTENSSRSKSSVLCLRAKQPVIQLGA